MDAITRLNKAQDNRIKVLETIAKTYTKGDLNEIFEIQNQLKTQDRRAVNKAVNDLKKSEQKISLPEKKSSCGIC